MTGKKVQFYPFALRRAALGLALLAVGSLPCFGQASKSAPIFGQIEQITSELSAITGWTAKRKVPSEILTKEKFRKYVESQTDGRAKRKAIQAEETALKMLGLVPPEFRLREEMVDLLDEQAAAFYDYRRKRLYVLNTTREGEDQRAALIHELAHALADQQHPLGKYLNGAGDDNDAATAREAVIEGQATWLTWAYQAKQITGRAEISQGMLDQLLMADDNQSSGFPVLSAAPLYVRESLLFPYNAGARFQDAVFRRLGLRAFEQVFAKGPLSTQQILHPDDYMKETRPASPELSALDKEVGLRPKDFDEILAGNLGEFDHGVLLRQYTSKADAKAAEHWRGGAFRLLEQKKQKFALLSYVSEWDSEQWARRFFELYESILRGKWKTMRVASRTETEIRGSGDFGEFTVRLTGNTVRSIEGMGGPSAASTTERAKGNSGKRPPIAVN
ncbi:MAG: hypothetical protein ABL967_07880 [Bryobacteraceae bacterium]